MESVHKSHMSLLPTVLVLGHIWVHVCPTYCCNITYYIKESVNECLAELLLCISQMSIQTIAISDLGETLMTLSLEAI